MPPSPHRNGAVADSGLAGEALSAPLQRFPGSVRLQRLRGLLLRRTGDLKTAQHVLTKLLEDSQRATEPPGLLAAVWADGWTMREQVGDSSSARDALEAALTRDLEQAKTLATRVLEHLNERFRSEAGRL